MSEQQEFEVSPTLRRRLGRTGMIAAAIAALIVASGLGLRWYQGAEVRAWTNDRAIPIVSLVSSAAGGSSGAAELVLPGTVRAFVEAPIYARVGGYLKRWTVDIGAHVSAGDLLATIETPELDQQLLQAQADLATARANESLSATTAARWQHMLAADAVSRQEAEEKAGDHAAKIANVAAAEANVSRLKATAAFKSIVAPFTGVITARKTDIGALINAGAGSGQELFRIADARKVRVYVEIPQSYASDVRVGSAADLHVPERPGTTIAATVTDSSRAINETSRTMLVQLEADNRDGTLLPGSYVQVHFPMTGRAKARRIPVSALVFRHEGMQVAVLDSSDRVRLQSIRVGRDFGTEIEVLDGIAAGDRIVNSPPDGIDEHALVRVAPTAPVAGLRP